MKTYIVAVAILCVPTLALAQFGSIDAFLLNISTFINNILIPLVFALSLLMFIYGMFRYFIQGGDNSGDREVGQELMVWSIVGFVLMVSIWGIVNLLSSGLQEGLGTENDRLNTLPTGPIISE